MTCWYVDIENVRARFEGLVADMSQHDHLFLFYTDPVEKLPISCWQRVYKAIVHPHFIIVEPTGPNAADFAIMVEMGRQSLLHPGCEHRCVTNDKGFDGGIAHLRSYGEKCSRVPAYAYELEDAELGIIHATSDIKDSSSRKQAINVMCMKQYGHVSAGLHYSRIKQLLIQRGELWA